MSLLNVLLEMLLVQFKQALNFPIYTIVQGIVKSPKGYDGQPV